MDTLHAKAEWERVGERWFRKTQQYTSIFDESLDLDNYIVAAAPYGGALGMPPFIAESKPRLLSSAFSCFPAQPD